MGFNPFGGMFDFDQDGKTDVFEMALGFQIMDEMDRQSLAQRGESRLFGSTCDVDEPDDEDI